MKVVFVVLSFLFFQDIHSVKIVGWDNYPIERRRILILNSDGPDKIYKSTSNGVISLTDDEYQLNKNKVILIIFEDQGMVKKMYKIPEKLTWDNLTLGELMSNEKYKLERK